MAITTDNRWLVDPVESGSAAGLGVYLHVPFCAHRCGYCDFATAVPDSDDQVRRYVQALQSEVHATEADERPVTSVFVGGGTPTLLPRGDLAALLAAEADTPVDGCVVFGYPFHPPGKPEKTRLDHFPALAAPVLICQGERDPFGKPREVTGYDLPSPVTVHWVTDGDHDFTPRKRSGIDPRANRIDAADQAVNFIRGRVSP